MHFFNLMNIPLSGLSSGMLGYLAEFQRTVTSVADELKQLGSCLRKEGFLREQYFTNTEIYPQGNLKQKKQNSLSRVETYTKILRINARRPYFHKIFHIL